MEIRTRSQIEERPRFISNKEWLETTDNFREQIHTLADRIIQLDLATGENGGTGREQYGYGTIVNDNGHERMVSVQFYLQSGSDPAIVNEDGSIDWSDPFISGFHTVSVMLTDPEGRYSDGLVTTTYGSVQYGQKNGITYSKDNSDSGIGVYEKGSATVTEAMRLLELAQ